jgi:hypothetical protein
MIHHTQCAQRAFTSPLGAGRVTSAGVQQVYSVLQAATGSLGGNGNSGAIYGELTQASMQRVVDLLKVHLTDLRQFSGILYCLCNVRIHNAYASLHISNCSCATGMYACRCTCSYAVGMYACKYTYV